MTLEEFRHTVRVLPPDEACSVRSRFEETFVADGSPGPNLWDRLGCPQRVSLARLWATVSSTDVVHVMWDPPVVASPAVDARSFATDAVLECGVADLELGVDWLPEDLYVFDDSFSWSAVFTHERDRDGGVVLLAGPVGSSIRRSVGVDLEEEP